MSPPPPVSLFLPLPPNPPSLPWLRPRRDGATPPPRLPGSGISHARSIHGIYSCAKARVAIILAITRKEAGTVSPFGNVVWPSKIQAYRSAPFIVFSGICRLLVSIVHVQSSNHSATPPARARDSLGLSLRVKRQLNSVLRQQSGNAQRLLVLYL